MPYARQKRQYKYMLDELHIPLEFIFSFNTIYQKRCTLCVMSELEHVAPKCFVFHMHSVRTGTLIQILYASRVIAYN